MSAPPRSSTCGRSAGSALRRHATPPCSTRPWRRSPPPRPACWPRWRCARPPGGLSPSEIARGRVVTDQDGHQARPQAELADVVRLVDGYPVRPRGDHLLHPDHHDPVRHRGVPDRQLCDMAVRAVDRRAARRGDRLADRQHNLDHPHRLVAGYRPPDQRDRALPDDHRHPARPRRLQADPDLADTARRPDRPVRRALPRLPPGWRLLIPRRPGTGPPPAHPAVAGTYTAPPPPPGSAPEPRARSPAMTRAVMCGGRKPATADGGTNRNSSSSDSWSTIAETSASTPPSKTNATIGRGRAPSAATQSTASSGPTGTERPSSSRTSRAQPTCGASPCSRTPPGSDHRSR